jgi:hypothetical protein
MEGLNCGMRIAVGSLPLMDPSVAVRFQCHAFPEVPSWPQLPKLNSKERITHQGLNGLPGLIFRPEGTVQWNDPPEGLESLAARFQKERRENLLENGAFHKEDAPGFFAFLEEGPRYFSAVTAGVKGQCAGPVTLGLSMRNREGRPILESASHMDVLSEYLALHAIWQCKKLSVLGKPVVFFIDEPSMGRFEPGKYGRSWEEIQSWSNRILEPLQEMGVLTGYHLCGKGPYWWALESSAECLHVDAYRYLDELREDAPALQHFLEQGGWIAFGIVPTAMSGGTFPESASLVDRWLAFTYSMGRLGVDPDLLASRSVFSTSCGLGGGSQAVAEEASRCLSGMVSLWRIAADMGLKP